MKNKNKYIALALALSTTTINVNAETIFNDVTNHWAKDAINKLAKLEIIKGSGNNLFEPNRSVTRAEFITIVNKYFYLDGTVRYLPYKDVVVGSWYENDLKIAYANKYISKSETFRPNDPITREEACTILMKLIGCIDYNLDKINNYDDYRMMSEWAKPYIEGAIELGFIEGDNKGNINPKDSLTRAEASIFISRLYRNLDEYEINFSGNNSSNNNSSNNNTTVEAIVDKLNSMTVNQLDSIINTTSRNIATTEMTNIFGIKNVSFSYYLNEYSFDKLIGNQTSTNFLPNYVGKIHIGNTNSDGKVTKAELTSLIKQILFNLKSQYSSLQTELTKAENIGLSVYFKDDELYLSITMDKLASTNVVVNELNSITVNSTNSVINNTYRNYILSELNKFYKIDLSVAQILNQYSLDIASGINPPNPNNYENFITSVSLGNVNVDGKVTKDEINSLINELFNNLINYNHQIKNHIINSKNIGISLYVNNGKLYLSLTIEKMGLTKVEIIEPTLISVGTSIDLQAVTKHDNGEIIDNTTLTWELVDNWVSGVVNLTPNGTLTVYDKIDKLIVKVTATLDGKTSEDTIDLAPYLVKGNKPVISSSIGKDLITLNVGDDVSNINWASYVTVTDIEDGPTIIPIISNENKINTSIISSAPYVVTFTAIDSDGNITTYDMNVIVK